MIKKMILVSVVISSLLSTPIYAETNQEFIDSISKHAQEIAWENDMYASVIIAQAIHESNWGTSGLSISDNNLFGIKGAYNGQGTVYNTQEEAPDGTYYTIQSMFRKYPSRKESLDDLVDLIKNYKDGFYSDSWKSNTKNYKEATKALTGKYATDSKYNIKLNNYIEEYGLTKYDKKPPEPIYPLTVAQEKEVFSSNQIETVIYPLSIGPEIKAPIPLDLTLAVAVVTILKSFI